MADTEWLVRWAYPPVNERAMMAANRVGKTWGAGGYETALHLTGRYPDSLYDFAVGVLRWSVRVESYLLLLHDEYPPFSLG